MDKISRAAVLVAGDFRTWPRASQYIFDYVDDICQQADYYFATWSTTRDYWYPQMHSEKTQRNVTDHDIKTKFIENNKTLINFVIVTDRPAVFYGTNYLQSYLANRANLLKRRYELDNGFVYDQVLEIRPDLYIYDSNKENITNLKDFELLMDVTRDVLVPGSQLFPEAIDFYYRTNSLTSDIMCNRFFYQKSLHVEFYRTQYDHWPLPIHNHTILADYVLVRRLHSIANQDSFQQIVIRPNFPPGDLRTIPYEELWELQRQFLDYTRSLPRE